VLISAVSNCEGERVHENIVLSASTTGTGRSIRESETQVNKETHVLAARPHRVRATLKFPVSATALRHILTEWKALRPTNSGG
jgi:hypothetical protein